MQRFYLSSLSLVLVLGIGLGGCRNSSPDIAAPQTPASTPTDIPTATPTPTSTAEPTNSPAPMVSPGPTPATMLGVSLEPPRTAVLTARQADARINLRSQPTTESTDKGYGLVGDAITLLRQTTGEGDFTWYYVKFAGSGAEGWVRGDFVDTQNRSNPAPATSSEGFEAEGACSGTLKTRYDSDSFMIFICQLRDGGLRYIGRNTQTGDVLITDNVSAVEDGFVAKQGSYEYHLSPNAIGVYRVEDGQYTQLTEETIQSMQSL